MIFKEQHPETDWHEEREQKDHWSGAMVMSELWM